jgi:type II secretory pathway pseudopilin PulG
MIKLNLKNKNQSKTKGGYSLVELLFYISLFFIIALAVIDSLITMTKAFRETSLQAEFGESSAIMERISREIRKARSINTISASDLKINTTDDAGVSKTVEFLLSGSNVQLLENSVLTGNLNTPNITVTALTFTQITTTAGVAVKIFLTISSNNDTLARSVDFYDTVVLRGSY